MWNAYIATGQCEVFIMVAKVCWSTELTSCRLEAERENAYINGQFTFVSFWLLSMVTPTFRAGPPHLVNLLLKYSHGYSRGVLY